MQQSIPILYPSNVQNAGQLSILLYKFSLNSPNVFVLLYCLNAENLITFAPTQTVQLNPYRTNVENRVSS